MEKKYITWEEIFEALKEIDVPGKIIYGVPNGGMIAAGFLNKATITHQADEADIILDDIIDSGHTKKIYHDIYPQTMFHGLYNKPIEDTRWYVFPWEKDHPKTNTENAVQQNIIRQLQYIGEDVTREGLKETPNRIVRSWNEIYAGYAQDPKDLLTTFDGEGYDQIILCKNIEMFSMCEHHLLPFFGKAHIAYIPNKRVIGISKLARLLDVYARRAQIQERIGEQVTKALMEYLQPLGVACIIEATHMCMRMRGCSKQQSTMVTSSMKGVFMDNPDSKQELIQLIKGGE